MLETSLVGRLVETAETKHAYRIIRDKAMFGVDQDVFFDPNLIAAMTEVECDHYFAPEFQ